LHQKQQLARQMLNCSETKAERNLPIMIPTEKKFQSLGFQESSRSSSLAKEVNIDSKRKSFTDEGITTIDL
jgi:hypothetical protein